MQPAVLIRLRPVGPWRFGPGDGGHDRVDALYRSDRLYSAVTLAMKRLGFLEGWLDETARATSPAVAFTSLFPFQGTNLFITPPATLWPPPAPLLMTPNPVFLSKIRWSAARFVPVTLVESILLGQNVLADQWQPDPQSACLLRRDRPNTTPFHTVLRSGGAVDRITHSAVNVHAAACIEFEPGAGLWTVARFRDEDARGQWADRVAAAFRLLADTGFGGRRSSGWGQTEAPELQAGAWPDLLFPKLTRFLARNTTSGDSSEQSSLHWVLSLFVPSSADTVDWSGGDYQSTVRGGYVEDSAASGAQKKQTRMIAEGSVLASENELVGAAVDVAPNGFPHPVYRSGLAVSLKLPVIEAGKETAEAEPVTEPDPEPQSDPVTKSDPEPEIAPEPAIEPVESEYKAAEHPSFAPELSVDPEPGVISESSSSLEAESPEPVPEASSVEDSAQDSRRASEGPDNGI